MRIAYLRLLCVSVLAAVIMILHRFLWGTEKFTNNIYNKPLLFSCLQLSILVMRRAMDWQLSFTEDTHAKEWDIRDGRRSTIWYNGDDLHATSHIFGLCSVDACSRCDTWKMKPNDFIGADWWLHRFCWRLHRCCLVTSSMRVHAGVTYSNTVPVLQPQHGVLHGLARALAADRGALQIVCAEYVVAAVQRHVASPVLTTVEHCNKNASLRFFIKFSS